MRTEQESLATLQFSRDEIALITGAPTDEHAFLRGTLIAQAEVRKSILQMAKQGSSPAQKQFLDLVASPISVSSRQVNSVLAWADKQKEDDYCEGVANAIRWIFHSGKSPKDSY